MSHSPIPGAQPWFGDSLDPIMDDMREVLSSGQLTQGKHVAEFEKGMSEITADCHAMAVTSGGTALELALSAFDVRDREVIVPTQTFVASANAVVRAGGKPVFADIEPDTMSIDPQDVARKITPRTAGVMCVHMFGLIAPSAFTIRDICNDANLFMIEDAAHAHGASLHGEPAGAIGDAGCFSFYATKVLTTCEGGIITSSREDIFETVLKLRNHGRDLTGPTFDMAGNNYRMTEMQGVLGRHQLKLLPQIVAHRQAVAAVYHELLADNDLVRLLPEFEEANHVFWRFPAYLDSSIDRDAFQHKMWDDHGIRTTWMYEPLCHLQPYYMRTQGHKSGDLPVAEKYIQRLINLPVHMGVSTEDAVRVAEATKTVLQELGG